MESVKRKLQKNPCENANPLSRLIFFWTKIYFMKGYSKTLDTEDICEPLSSDKSKLLGERLDKTWNDQLKGGRKHPSLIKAIARAFWREYLFLFFVTFIHDVVVRLSLPIILGKLLLYFRKDSDMSHTEALQYAAGIVVMSILGGLSINHYFMSGFYNGMKVRVAVCSLIYKKILRLSHTALGDTAPGKIANLLSNDVNRFDIASLVINALWNSPLMTIIAGYLLWREARWAGLIGIAVVFVVVPIQVYAGKFSSKFRYRTALRTDERVRFMDEIVSGVQVIKMYAWEQPFTYLITMARKMELNVLLKYTYIRAIYMTFMLFTTRMALFCTMLSIVLLYGQENLTVSKVFVIAAFFGAISFSMSQTFVRAVAEISEALVAIRRLQKFMEYEEKIAVPIMRLPNGLDGGLIKNQTIVEAEDLTSRNVSVSLKGVTARWVGEKNTENKKKKKKVTKENVNGTHNHILEEPTLQNLNIEFQKGKLIGIIGPVGAGKSSLLQVLLREMPLESGEINAYGSISYACQEPWVFAGSVRQNILFGQQMNRERYDSVVKACALIKDFEQLEEGDDSFIGERGMSLSGGQKARVNLARAVYHKADIYLMDDPLSAVDSHVGVHLFNDCIGPSSLLARENATRILVTHQVHFLRQADWIIVLKNGKVEFQGTNNDVANSGIDFATLLATEEEDESTQEQTGIRTRFSRSNSRSSAKSASVHSEQDSIIAEIEDFTAAPQELEASSKGKVKGSLFFQYLQSGAHSLVLFLLFLLFLTAQILASGADYFVAFWTHQEELRTYYSNQNNTILSSENSRTAESLANIQRETGDLSTTNGTVVVESHPALLSTETCAYIHGSIILTLLLIAFVRTLMFFRLCINASQNLHDNMFKSIISTTMRFFDLNPSGRILNRFSKDIGSADEYLPKAILDAGQIILIMFGSICVTIIVNPMLLIPLFVFGLIFVFLRRVYLKSSKDIKRLEGIAKSPVFTHISATLYGLSTIRALNAEKILVSEFDNHQDTHTACCFMFLAMGSAFGITLDLLCVIFIFCVVFAFLLIDTGITGDKVALAITQSLALTGFLQWGVRQSAEIQNQLMSVERILEYSLLEPEKEPEKAIELSKDWPSNGKLEFRNVFYRYFLEAEPVLRGLSFVIQPREKIGIVGRTGAGKSSLIGAIFRLAQIEGEILIDNVDTSTIKLNELRTKISIIPQDPVLFSGTMRRNLDPFDEYADADIWKSLEDVELKDICGVAGLQSNVMAHGSNFSVGQRQLLCLARAILRKNKILVLDEATANVDPHTDLLIQQTIREKFNECTVLTVAHRLNTIIDSDRVLVMEAGKAIEFDTPYKLMTDQTTIFAGMIAALGLQEFSRLLNAAKDKHNKKNL